jgi:phosphoribosyl 1,2-cyclic phosphodiesterase
MTGLISTLQKNNNPQHTHSTHPEARTIKNIKTNLKEKEALITHANKQNDAKITDFI